VALDGDGDRLIMVDRSGTVFDGDQLLYTIVKDRLRHVSVEAVLGVVGTLMTNLGFEHAMHRLHIDFRRAKVGDRYVMEMLKETGWLLGGESSGHILCLDQHTTGDGIVSALQVLAAIVRFNLPLAELVKEFERYPQTLINVPMPVQNDWQKAPGVAQACAEAQKRLAEQGRLLIRPSGTEPVVRVMVEARQAELAQSTAQAVADAIRRI
jgi:phosphoglucosamine mutase